MRILIVEDSATLRATMQSYISDMSHTPFSASSGENALQILEDNEFDLIIMDVEMPGLDGFETTRQIREEQTGRWIPIIFVTGKTDDDSYREGIAAGGDDYLTKPVNPVILEAKITAMERISEMQWELARLNIDLAHLSERDGLTQLYNRRAFTERADQSWKANIRANTPCALLMMDVDHFKQYNDNYGHVAGDECLQAVSKALDDAIQRPGDLLARYGGEEFIAFLPDTDEKGAEIVAQGILDSINSKNLEHKYSSAGEHVSISIGMSLAHCSDDFCIPSLILAADELLYEAKETGRNRSVSKSQVIDKNILLVDDDDLCTETISNILKGMANITVVHSGEECLKLAKDTVFDLILLDQSMPELDGCGTCKILKTDKQTASIPVIFITGSEDKKAIKAAGGNDFLSKPINDQLLLRKVKRFL